MSCVCCLVDVVWGVWIVWFDGLVVIEGCMFVLVVVWFFFF